MTFLRISTTPIALAALLTIGYIGTTPKKDKRLILSFYVDDTSPGIAGPQAYRTFLEYCKAHGIRGESTVLLGYDGESMAEDPDGVERVFLDYAKRSYEYGIDTHMEIMTHHELFDFESGKKREKGIHEGLWLHEPSVTANEYYRYFSNIIAEGERVGVRFTGLTWPGCGCEACSLRYGELRKAGPLRFNPAVWEALLNLVKQGKFRNRVIPVFYESSETDFDIVQKAADGSFAVYDLMPNAEDHIGTWENTTARVDPGYYISEDGRSGIIIRHLQSRAPYCLWYMHWQGLDPEKGVGWEAFKTVIERIEKHLNDKVVWMRPSDIVIRYHDAGGWEFLESQ
ncbi:MAG: hypothetical protein HXY20_04585 [Acidobacteria bacterium]|nr:hypothetical protein [Acidobacteriota bacterium]